MSGEKVSGVRYRFLGVVSAQSLEKGGFWVQCALRRAIGSPCGMFRTGIGPRWNRLGWQIT